MSSNISVFIASVLCSLLFLSTVSCGVVDTSVDATVTAGLEETGVINVGLGDTLVYEFIRTKHIVMLKNGIDTGWDNTPIPADTVFFLIESKPLRLNYNKLSAKFIVQLFGIDNRYWESELDVTATSVCYTFMQNDGRQYVLSPRRLLSYDYGIGNVWADTTFQDLNFGYVQNVSHSSLIARDTTCKALGDMRVDCFVRENADYLLGWRSVTTAFVRNGIAVEYVIHDQKWDRALGNTSTGPKTYYTHSARLLGKKKMARTVDSVVVK